MAALHIAEDRSLLVPSGAVIKTGYAEIEQIALACRDRMSVGAIDAAMKRMMAASPGQPWPCPVGEWRQDRFYILDGRHAAIAAMMLGMSHLFVAWIEYPDKETSPSKTEA